MTECGPGQGCFSDVDGCAAGEFASAAAAAAPIPGRKTVIGYYASWQWYDRDKLADPAKVDFSKYDRINYAFFQPSPSGNLYGTDEWGDPQLLWGPYVWDAARQVDDGPDRNYFCSWDGPLGERGGEGERNCMYHDLDGGLLRRARRAGTQVMPSIGGWTLSDNFPTIARTRAGRDNFARQCADLVRAYGFDGIDIDWEYPGYKDHSGTPEDTVNFTLLLRAVRDELDRLGAERGTFYPLTAALPCGPDKIGDIQVERVKDILTELNLMSYDMHGAWDALSGTNAPLVDQGWGDEVRGMSVHGCVDSYVRRGVPLRQMNVGLPFYGRSVRRATGLKQFHGGADDINYHLDEGSPQYFNIVNELQRMTTYRHQRTRTQYAVFDDTGGLVSYDDPRAICDKVAYANERGMNGFLIWEISGDMIETEAGQIATPLVDAANAKIENPDFDCSALRDPPWALRDATYRHAPPEPATVDWSEYAPPLGDAGSANDFDGARDSSGDGAPAARPPLVATGTEEAAPSDPARGAEGGPGDDPGDDPGEEEEEEAAAVDCPPDYTGYFSTSDCVMYGYCQFGEPVGVALPCVPGTLFDVSTSACTWANMVSCGQSPAIEEEEEEMEEEVDGQAGLVPDMGDIPNGNAWPSFVGEEVDASASFINSNRASDVDLNINIYVDLNPSNFFCGMSPEDAAELCLPCPSGLMIDCGDDFRRGCFRDITGCATRGNGNR